MRNNDKATMKKLAKAKRALRHAQRNSDGAQAAMLRQVVTFHSDKLHTKEDRNHG